MDLERQAHAAFTISMTPTTADLDGTGRFEFTKSWSGELEGESRGAMFSAGDPTSGEAGYLAHEVFTGSLSGRRGSFVLHQLGSMTAGQVVQHYLVVPGSGTGELAGITGTIALDATDAEHRVVFDYRLDR